MDAEVFDTRSPAGTKALGRRLAGRLGAGDCVGLIGPLGAGKTVLVRGIAIALGLDDERLVASPTFVLEREYPGRVTIHHLDLYRMADPSAELAELGMGEMLADGVVLIEWADRAGDTLPRPRWRLDIEITGERSRRFALRRIP